MVAEDSFLVFVDGFCKNLLEDAVEDLVLDDGLVGVECRPLGLAAAPLREQYVVDVVRPPRSDTCSSNYFQNILKFFLRLA